MSCFSKEMDISIFSYFEARNEIEFRLSEKGIHPLFTEENLRINMETLVHENLATAVM